METIKKINVQEYETRFPNSNDLYFKRLTYNQKKEYLNLYSIYLSMMLNYIDSKSLIKKFDDMLLNSNVKFKPVEEKNMDIYQYCCSSFLMYFYIRNNIYIERLAPKEIEFLKTHDTKSIEQKNIFIQKTINKVIKESNDDELYNINYGPESPDYIVPNNSLIIGVRFDDYYVDEKQADEEWISNYNIKLSKLNILKDFMAKKFTKELNIPVDIIKYNDFSIKKKKIDDQYENNNTKHR